MPREIPHQRTILHLVPQNKLAEGVLTHPDNAPFVSVATQKNGKKAVKELGLEIGYHVAMRPCREVIVEVGRNADLILPAPSISKCHFSFETHPESKKIMFHDRSRYRSTTIHPASFRTDGDFRQVVLCPPTEYSIGVGGEDKDLYTFRVYWVVEKDGEVQTELSEQMSQERMENPRWARTVDDGPTELHSWYNTRLHTPWGGGVQRTLDMGQLGQGAFGLVSKAVDRDSGKLIAIKTITLPPKFNGVPSEKENRLYREVKILSSISHVRRFFVFVFFFFLFRNFGLAQ